MWVLFGNLKPSIEHLCFVKGPKYTYLTRHKYDCSSNYIMLVKSIAHNKEEESWPIFSKNVANISQILYQTCLCRHVIQTFLWQICWIIVRKGGVKNSSHLISLLYPLNNWIHSLATSPDIDLFSNSTWHYLNLQTFFHWNLFLSSKI